MKMKAESEKDHLVVLPSKFGGGPLGLGDPNDTHLRKVEIEILIPKKMREKARIVKCFHEVEDFEKCCKNSGIGMVLRCRKENDNLKKCLTHWYQDEDFKKECISEYLEERSEYRRTGKKQEAVKKESTSF